MRICFAGTPEVAVPSLHALAGSGHEVLAVITRPDAARGRSRHLLPSAVADAANELGLETLKPLNPSQSDFIGRLRELSPDCVAVVAYGAMIPNAALDLVPAGWINLHFSLLPAWRGAAPVPHAILTGDEMTGATTFQIVPQLDAGPIFGQMTYRLPARATTGKVLRELSTSADRLLVATLDAVDAGEALAVEQNPTQVSLAPKISVAQAQIDWTKPALAIDRLIRAMDPAPGAWTTWRGQRLRLARPSLAPDAVMHPGQPSDLGPGQVSAGKDQVWVGTGSVALRLSQVQPSGKPTKIDAAAWARGARPGPDDRLGGRP